jgi:hypothetical protein
MNNNKQQTALEWLEDTLYPYLNKEDKEYTDVLFNKAKEMEKEQIMKAVYDSMGTNLDPNIGRAEIYYNETFNK